MKSIVFLGLICQFIRKVVAAIYTSGRLESHYRYCVSRKDACGGKIFEDSLHVVTTVDIYKEKQEK